MGSGYRHLFAAALLASLSGPASAEVVLTTEGMTGTGLPPGQTLPETPQQSTPAPAPFTPKIVTTEKMQAWGPAATPGSTDTTPSGSDSSGDTATGTTTNRTQPPVRRMDRQRIRKVPPTELKPAEIKPMEVKPTVRPERRLP